PEMSRGLGYLYKRQPLSRCKRTFFCIFFENSSFKMLFPRKRRTVAAVLCLPYRFAVNSACKTVPFRLK
ncbi:MAG: hypothetical protein K2M90_03220, partial [Treponemataceae bacterium]|nr:hypothetical protein [Treponemataceae bacterium]